MLESVQSYEAWWINISRGKVFKNIDPVGKCSRLGKCVHHAF